MKLRRANQPRMLKTPERETFSLNLDRAITARFFVWILNTLRGGICPSEVDPCLACPKPGLMSIRLFALFDTSDNQEKREKHDNMIVPIIKP